MPLPIIQNHHAGSKNPDFDGDDLDKMIEKGGCAKDYYLLEDCLGENDRDWTKCQEQVRNLKRCNEQLMKKKQS